MDVAYGLFTDDSNSKEQGVIVGKHAGKSRRSKSRISGCFVFFKDF